MGGFEGLATEGELIFLHLVERFLEGVELVLEVGDVGVAVSDLGFEGVALGVVEEGFGFGVGAGSGWE